MNFVESNGSKIAAVLCVASCFPVVATIYASGTQPGMQGDKYINEDSTVAKGWQEIEGKSWFFKEDGSLDKETTKDATVAKVSTTISEDVKEDIEGTTKQYVEEVNIEEAVAPIETVESTVSVEEVLFAEYEAPVQNSEEVYIPEETYYEPVEEVYYEAPAEEAVVEEAVVEEAVVEEVYVEAPVEETVVEAPAEEVVVETPVEEVVVEAPVEEVYYEEVPSEPIYEDNTIVATSTGQQIADAAMGLVGVTDGWQCTEVATQALINAGIEGVPVCWPDQYQYYGDVSYEAVVGSLAYYYNGGRGYDHIAVYVGDGMCVHGNFDGQTIYYSETTADGSPDYYVVFE